MNVKNIFKKENVMPVAVLAVICLVVAALMGAVNMLTEGVIKDREAAAIAESLKEVMPNGDFEEVELKESTPATVTKIYKDKNSGGHVVTLEKQGYASVIKLTVGIDSEKKVTKAIITSENETHGKTGFDKYIDSFSGTTSSGSQNVAHVSGATRTSEHIESAVYDAFVALGYAEAKDAEDTFDYAGVTDTTEEYVISKAGQMSGGSYEKASTDDMPTTVRGVYREASGKGYAIHIATRTKYVPLESEGIVIVDASGHITHIEMLSWNVGYDKEILDAAPECSKEFLDSFIGKNNSSLTRVELVTHATLTSNNFTDALTAALDVIYPVPLYSVAAIATVAVLVIALVGAVVYIKIKRRRNG